MFLLLILNIFHLFLVFLMTILNKRMLAGAQLELQILKNNSKYFVSVLLYEELTFFWSFSDHGNFYIYSVGKTKLQLSSLYYPRDFQCHLDKWLHQSNQPVVFLILSHLTKTEVMKSKKNSKEKKIVRKNVPGKFATFATLWFLRSKKVNKTHLILARDLRKWIT